MSPRRNIPIRYLRWTAVWLVLLQLGVIGLGHQLHHWMHQTAHSVRGAAHAGHAGCGGCVADSTIQDALIPDSLASGCCSSSSDGLEAVAPTAPAEARLAALERAAGLNAPVAQRCWSWDCAFFRGIHQPLTLTAPIPLVGIDQLSSELALPTAPSAAVGECFSLRARGPPLA